ncbi:MAG TPA: TonB-dependent receptor [Burkholderiaceae bacterium]
MKALAKKPVTRNVLRALSAVCMASSIFAPDFAQAQQATDLGTVSGSGNGASAPVPAAAKVAVSQGSLDARSAQSIVSDDYVRNFTTPEADFSQVFEITPGAFSFSPNGVGNGNASTTVRGLNDSQYLITYDGIPFNDTNGVSHHSYVFFPGMAIGGAVIDRSPGSAATIGQATFGGSLNLLSRNLEPSRRFSLTGSYGSWDTRLGIAEYESGQIGPEGRSNLLVNVQQMNSNGYMTLDSQDRQALSLKYQYIVSPSTVVTFVESYMDVRNSQLDAGAPTRAQIALYGDNYLNDNNPADSNFWGYNKYNVQTNFQYVGVKSDLGNGWKLDDKLYNYGYINHQNIGGNPVTTGTVAAQDTAVDKLNEYHTTGNLLRVTDDISMGTFRTGLWTEYANSNRHQFPSNELTGWIDAPAPNFSETYGTTTVQPYAEFEFKVNDDLKITPGLKYAYYHQDYNHLQSLKKTGPLGGTISKSADSITGGLPSVNQYVSYNDWMPSIDAHYFIQNNWAAYAQYAEGDLIPPTSVFDAKIAVANGAPLPAVAQEPKAQKSHTFQIGTDYKSDSLAFDANLFHVKLDNSYSCGVDPTDITTTICVAAGSEITQGVEVEGTFLVGGGFSIYANGTLGTTKYRGGSLDGKWAAGAPGNTETLGLIYKDGPWNAALYTKRVGKVYNDGENPGDNAYLIDPVTLTNLFANYSFKIPGNFAKQGKLQFAVNNLFDSHAVTGISGSASSANPSQQDYISELPGRSATLTLTLDF